LDKRVTLKDLAKASGYSLTSIHRAINNKEGISDDVREKILKIAEEMGYEVNYLASSLKKTPIRIALVMASPTSSGGYYAHILKGCTDMLDDMSAFNCQLLHYFSDIEGNSESNQLNILDLLYTNESDKLDGLIIVPVKNTNAIKNSLERFIAGGTTVLLIDNEFPKLDHLCCISPQEFMTGRLGAEFLCGLQPKKGTILVATGDKESLSHAYNLKGFSDFIKEYNLPYEILEVNDGKNIQEFYDNTFSILKTRKDIVALYSVRARNTIPLCQIAKKLNLVEKLKIVGSDLFPESAKMLEKGILNGIIYKNPYQKGFIGMKTIFDYLVKGERPKNKMKRVEISVILRSNLEFFTDVL